MLTYSKEEGFPMTIIIETSDYEEIMEDNEIWKGYESIVINENQEVIARFIHSELKNRFTWAEGFFTGIKLLESSKEELLFNSDYICKGPETPLLGEDNKSNLEVGDWIVTKNGKVLKIEFDDQDNLPFGIIERFATKSEIKNAKEINILAKTLDAEKARNRVSWNIYGSELCSGEMIKKEEEIENQIEQLRNENN